MDKLSDCLPVKREGHVRDSIQVTDDVVGEGIEHIHRRPGELNRDCGRNCPWGAWVERRIVPSPIIELRGTGAYEAMVIVRGPLTPLFARGILGGQVGERVSVVVVDSTISRSSSGRAGREEMVEIVNDVERS